MFLEEINYFEILGITPEDFIQVLLEDPEIELIEHDAEEGVIHIKSHSFGEATFQYRKKTISGSA
jgi:hypothetical protein